MTFKSSFPSHSEYRQTFTPPAALGWPQAYHPHAERDGCRFRSALAPQSMVDAAIWNGPAYHVDPVSGSDSNSGLAKRNGDFTNAKRSIHAAFTAGNATGAPYRVLLKPGFYSEGSFSSNGSVEPNQPVAIIGYEGEAVYRTGPGSVTWTAGNGDDFSAPVTGVQRAFDTGDSVNGKPVPLTEAADLAECETTPGTFYQDASAVHVNIGATPDPDRIALIRAFHGARFLNHAGDLYLENLRLQGGISGALHCDPIAARNIVGVNCVFEMSAPSESSPDPDAVTIRRTSGLVAFFDSRADLGAKDGWNFHADGVTGMHVLLSGCHGAANGAPGPTSCNALTLHDDVKGVAIGGDFGWSSNGTEVHIIQDARLWALGAHATARDIDGTSTAFKCSNTAAMWLEETTADAQGSASNYGIDANGGAVFKRNHTNLFCDETTASGGVISTY